MIKLPLPLAATTSTPSDRSAAIFPPLFQNNSRLRRWSGMLARFVSVQLLVQILGFATGLLLVRTLSKQEYAIYTLANTMQGTLGVLADIGVGSALSAIGGRVWQDKERFGALITSALQVRRRLALVSALVVLPVALWTLLGNGVGWAYSLALCACLLLGQHFQLLNGVMIVVPRLFGQVDQLQKQTMLLTVLRLLVIAPVALFLPNAGFALLLSTFVLGIGAWQMRRTATRGADLTRPSLPEDERAIWKVVRQQTPGTIYYSFQGQITVFLLGWFGSADKVAEIGALGRITLMLTIIGSIMTSIVLPRFARCQEPRKVKRLYLSIVAVYVALSILLLAGSLIASGPLLALLGSSYKGLSKELFWTMLASMATMVNGAIYSLNSSRAWTERAWVSVPVSIVGQALMLLVVDPSSVAGVCILSTVAATINSLIFLFQARQSLHALERSQSENTESVAQ